jgi:hypothetical protein
MLMARRGILKSKSPSEVVDYGISWATRLGNDTISTSTWSVSGNDAALVIGVDTNTTTTTEVRLSGGTLYEQYSVKNVIVTVNGETFEQTALLTISVR